MSVNRYARVCNLLLFHSYCSASPLAFTPKHAPSTQVSFLWSQLGALQRWHATRLAAARDAALPEPTPDYQLRQQHSQEQQGGQQQQQQDKPPDGQDGAPSLPLLQVGEREALADLDASLESLWVAAPPGTLFLVVTGQGDTGYTRQGHQLAGNLRLQGRAWPLTTRPAPRVSAAHSCFTHAQPLHLWPCSANRSTASCVADTC